MKITLTDEQMKALQSGQSITIEPPKPVITKWEPKGGNYTITGKFLVEYMYPKPRKDLGLEYENNAQAEQAAKALRSYARKLAWLAENDDGWVADWDNRYQIKNYVYFDTKIKRYSIFHDSIDCNISSIYMSADNAEKLCVLLNMGVVEF